MRDKILGRTGSCVLSDDQIQYKLDKKRIVRYWYVRCAGGYRAEVVGPFHSALYGACGFGTGRTTAEKLRAAKAALKRNLANNYGYIGHMLFTTEDTADKIGVRYPGADTHSGPITHREAVGKAGM